MAQIKRTGRVTFGEASLHVLEEGIPRDWNERKEWEREFKHQVFARIIQQLKRIGWTVGPWEDAERYKAIANSRRTCSKGEHMHAHLDMTGRSISLEMWQSANTPTRPDHKGRYERDKEKVMPYLLRLEMERTRRRIRTYLCNVFEGYEFDGSKQQVAVEPGGITALQAIQRQYADSHHFKGADWEKYKSGSWMSRNIQSADGAVLEHGQTVWFTDRKGRWQRGTAFYNINNMWWVHYGPYSYTNQACFELYTKLPQDLRAKQNGNLRRKRLEQELNRATSNMDFERAILLRNQLFPEHQQVYVVWHREHQAYHCTGFSGYTQDQSRAGKFTLAEATRWVGSSEINQVLPLGQLP